MKKYERVKALVSLDAIAHNFEEMHKNVKEGTKIIAVIKADGYGHGARAIARLIQDYDYIWGFATATAEEALELRHAGITKPVLILGLVFEEYYEELAANDILHWCSWTVISVLQSFWKKEVFIFRYVTAPTVQVSSVFRKQISMSFVPVSPFTVFIRQRR